MREKEKEGDEEDEGGHSGRRSMCSALEGGGRRGEALGVEFKKVLNRSRNGGHDVWCW